METIIIFLFILKSTLCHNVFLLEKPIRGEENWGTQVNGLRYRITLEKSIYQIGETIRFSIEVHNNTETDIALGLEPLIEVAPNQFYRQEASLMVALWQPNLRVLFHSPFLIYPLELQSHRGWTKSLCRSFPKGSTIKEAKAITLPSHKIYTEFGEIVLADTELSYGILPTKIEVGNMTMRATSCQFLTDDLKKTCISSNVITFRVLAQKPIGRIQRIRTIICEQIRRLKKQ